MSSSPLVEVILLHGPGRLIRLQDSEGRVPTSAVNLEEEQEKSRLLPGFSNTSDHF